MMCTSTAVQVAAPFAVVASLEVVGGRSRSARTQYTVKGIERVNPFPTLLWCATVGSGKLQLSPLGVPGTDLKVGTECKGHREVITSRWWSELHLIHTN